MNYLKLIRWPNCLISALTVICGAFLLPELPPTKSILLAVVSAFGLTAFGNIDNDLADLKADRINHPRRSLSSGKIKRHTAIILSIFFAMLSMTTSLLLNFRCFLIVLSAVILLLAYNHNLKKVPLLSNIIIAVISGMAFIYAGYLSNSEFSFYWKLTC